MTKEEYIIIREKPDIPMNIWYEFFLERGGFSIGLDKFIEIFSNILLGSIIRKTNGEQTFVNFNSALSQFYKYYNNKFLL